MMRLILNWHSAVNSRSQRWTTGSARLVSQSVSAFFHSVNT